MRNKEIIEQIKNQEKKGGFTPRRKMTPVIPSLARDIKNLTKYIKEARQVTGEFKILEKHHRILYCGTGINAIAGQLLSSYVLEQNIEVIRNFSLPDDVDSKTLVIVSSFTGNDEPAIHCYKNALRKGCRIIGLTNGGRLLEGLKKNNTEHIVYPGTVTEQGSIAYLFFIPLFILENSRLIKTHRDIVNEMVRNLQTDLLKGMGVSLAQRLQDKIALIYTTPRTAPVAEYWKAQVNSIAKVPSFTQVLETGAYELDSYAKDLWDFFVVFLADEGDEKLNSIAMKTAKEVIKYQGYGTTEMKITGTNRLTRLFSAIHVGDNLALALKNYYKIELELFKKYRETFKTY